MNTLVLWDVDYTLVNAGGLGTRLYRAAFRALFGRDMAAVPPKAGRTERAIILDTIALAGVAEPHAYDIGAYGDAHEVRAELVPVARAAAAIAHGISYLGRSTVLVGDTPLDVAAALATGARAVGVATGSYSPTALAEAGAHAVLPDLKDPDRVRAAVLATSLVAAHPAAASSYKGSPGLGVMEGAGGHSQGDRNLVPGIMRRV